MIIINPKKELYVTNKTTVGMKGFFKFKTINKFSGKSRIDTDWIPNTILDAGRNVMATRSDWMNYCQVGTDNTAPSQVQTSLLGHVAGTSSIQSTTTGQASSAPYYGWKRKVFRFTAGTVAANLSEVGVGWGTTGSTLISRALILDPILQTPTTITPLADELLDVTYELRYYAPTTDVVLPQVTLDGVVYDTITRAALVTDAAWSTNIGSAIGVVTGTGNWVAYDDIIGTVLTGPSGTPANCDTSSQTNSTYSNNSYELKMNCPVGSSGWNLGAPGIRSVVFKTTAGWYQTQFDSNPGGLSIPKDSNYTMNMSWIISWTEKV